MTQPVPVHVIAGFLGTGKTSAIRALLESRAGEKAAVIVNDFGEASFDQLTLEEDAPFAITSIPGGCVCCTAPEGFVAALGAVLDGGPDRILIEPTGLARPQDLVDTIRRCPHRERLTLGPVVVLIDPQRVEGASAAERALVAEQVQVADVVVANRTDLASPEQMARFEELVKALWPEPLAVHRTTHGRIPPELLDWPAGEGSRIDRSAGRRAQAHDHPSTQGFRARSWRFAPDVVFERERLLRAVLRMAQVPGEGAALARFKGIFRTREGVVQIEVAGGTPHERATAYRRDSRADAIFEASDDAPLERAGTWLDSAILSDEERRAQASQIEVALPDRRVHVFSRERLAELPDGIDDVSTLFPKRTGRAARVGALFDAIGLPRRGFAVVCAADGFASEPVRCAALCEGVLLHSDAGEPLAEAKGGPFRLLIPEGVPDAPTACANVKAVTRIVLREGP